MSAQIGNILVRGYISFRGKSTIIGKLVEWNIKFSDVVFYETHFAKFVLNQKVG